MLTTQDVADTLGVSVDTVLRLITGGRLPAENVGAGSRNRFRVSSAALESFRDGRQVVQLRRGPKPRQLPRGALRQWATSGSSCL